MCLDCEQFSVMHLFIILLGVAKQEEIADGYLPHQRAVTQFTTKSYSTKIFCSKGSHSAYLFLDSV